MILGYFPGNECQGIDLSFCVYLVSFKHGLLVLPNKNAYCLLGSKYDRKMKLLNLIEFRHWPFDCFFTSQPSFYLLSLTILCFSISVVQYKNVKLMFIK